MGESSFSDGLSCSKAGKKPELGKEGENEHRYFK